MGGTLAIVALFTEYKLCKIIGIYTTKLTNKPINFMEKVKNRFGEAADLQIDPANLSKMLTGVTEMSLGTFCAINA